MKRSRKSLPTDEVEINVSPLIDMVFILLIFFIVATSFINESGITSRYKDTANKSLSKLSLKTSPNPRSQEGTWIPSSA